MPSAWLLSLLCLVFVCCFLFLICTPLFTHLILSLLVPHPTSIFFSMHVSVRPFVSFMGCSPVSSSAVAPSPPPAPPYLLIWRAAGYWGVTRSSHGSTFTTHTHTLDDRFVTRCPSLCPSIPAPVSQSQLLPPFYPQNLPLVLTPLPCKMSFFFQLKLCSQMYSFWLKASVKFWQGLISWLARVKILVTYATRTRPKASIGIHASLLGKVLNNTPKFG